LALMAVFAAGLISGATGATAPTHTNFTGSLFLESWADTTHGWRLVGTRSNSGGWPAVQATENGGRSWRRILRVGTGFEIGLISRVSSTDGFAFVGSKARERKNRYLVTSDSGRHWKRLTPGATG